MGVRNAEVGALTKKYNDSIAAAAAAKVTHEKELLMVSNKVANKHVPNTLKILYITSSITQLPSQHTR